MKSIAKIISVVFLLSLFLDLKVYAYKINSEINVYNGDKTDEFNDVYKTSDGGYIVVGSTYSSNINDEMSAKSEDGLIVKYDSNGQIEWQQVYGGSNVEYFSSVIETKDGYIVVGSIKSSDIEGIEKNNSNTYSDAIIVKYSKDGKIEWHKNYGGKDNDYFSSIIETSDGGYIAVGTTHSYVTDKPNFSQDGYIVKIKENGDKEWEQRYGGTGIEIFSSVIEAEDGYIVVGDFDSKEIDIDGVGKLTNNDTAKYNTKADALVVKYAKDGNVQWHNGYGGTENDSFASLTKTSDGGYVAVGSSSSNDIVGNKVNTDDDGNAIIVKYDKDNNIEWQKSFGTSGFMHNEKFNDVIETSDKEYLVTGYITFNVENLKVSGSRDGIIIKYDENGNIKWQANFDGGNKSYAVGKVDVAKSGSAIYDGLILTISFEYEITKEDTINGNFDVTVGEDNRGYITPYPDDGFQVKDVVVKDSLGNVINIEREDNNYYFDLYDDVTVSVTFEKITDNNNEENVKSEDKYSVDVEISKNPETGDNIFKYIGFLVTALAGIIIACVFMKKSSK